MTKGDLDGVTFLGRPVKPMSLQFTILLATLTIWNIINQGAFRDSILGDVIAVMAAVGVAALFSGWAIGSQRLAEVGLALSFFVYITRCAFLLGANGLLEEGIYLSIGAAVGAGGAYMLETWDRHDDPDYLTSWRFWNRGHRHEVVPE